MPMIQFLCKQNSKVLNLVDLSIRLHKIMDTLFLLVSKEKQKNQMKKSNVKNTVFIVRFLEL